MADLVLDPAIIEPGPGALMRRGLGGATIEAGDAVRFDAVRQRYELARAVVGLDEMAGIALNGAEDGQPISVLEWGPLFIGAGATRGRIYVLSTNAGRISPSQDLVAGDPVSVLGVATDAAVIEVRLQNSRTALELSEMWIATNFGPATDLTSNNPTVVASVLAPPLEDLLDIEARFLVAADGVADLLINVRQGGTEFGPSDGLNINTLAIENVGASLQHLDYRLKAWPRDAVTWNTLGWGTLSPETLGGTAITAVHGDLTNPTLGAPQYLKVVCQWLGGTNLSAIMRHCELRYRRRDTALVAP